MLTSFQKRFVAKRKSSTVTTVPDALQMRVQAEESSVTITPSKIESLLGMASPNITTYKTMHITPLVTLDPRMIARCFDALTEGVPFACLQRLNAELTRAGLQFSTNESELTPTDTMRTYIDNVLKPLQQDALRAICAIGVCPIAFRRDEPNGMIIPYVPAPKTYTIAVGTIRGLKYFELHWLPARFGQRLMRERQLGMQSDHHDDRLVSQSRFGYNSFGVPDPSVVVMHGFNTDPDVDGRICSIVSSFLMSSMDVSKRFVSAAIVAEGINANPPILRQYNSKADEARREALRGTEYVGEGVIDQVGEAEARRINNTYLRTERQITGFEMQNREARRQLASMAGYALDDDVAVACSTIARDPRSSSATDAFGNPMPWTNECALPEQWTTASYQLPHPRSDLVPLLDHWRDQVFYSFLMPSQVLNANARLSADADMAEKTLDVVVSEWRQSISRILTFAHDATYMQDDIEQALGATIRRKQVDSEPSQRDTLRLMLTDAEVAEIMETVATIRVSYRMKPPMKAADLDRMYARGVIKWQTYAQSLAQINGIDPAVVEATDRFPLEAQRMVGLPEYGQYLQIQDGRDHEEHRHSESQLQIKNQSEQAKAQLEVAKKQAEATAETAAKQPPTKKRKTAAKKK